MPETRYIIRYKGRRWGEVRATSKDEAIQRFMNAYPDWARAKMEGHLSAEAVR